MDEEHFLSTPYASELYERLQSVVPSESDRGAVLLSAEIVSQELKNEIIRLCPDHFSAKKIREIFDYSGFLGSFSARIHHAAMQGILAKNPFQAFTMLRKLRNKAAHSDEEFRLSDHSDQIRKMFDLGVGSYAVLRQQSLEALFEHMHETLKANGEEFDFDNPFETKGQLAQLLSERPDAMKRLENNTEKYELAVGIWIILSSVHVQTDKLLASRK